MPVVSDSAGRLAHVPDSWFFTEHPRDFLDKETYEKRIVLAQRRILNVVLALRHEPLPNDFVYFTSHLPSDFADFIDGLDGSRSRYARKVNASALRHSGLAAIDEKHVRSPQHMSRRRRSLFSLDDVPVLLFDAYARQRRSYEHFLDLMRWHLIHDAILRMIEDGELWYMNGIWQIRPSVMDRHRGCGRSRRSRKHRVEYDDRSFHGRPNRDRKRVAA